MRGAFVVLGLALVSALAGVAGADTPQEPDYAAMDAYVERVMSADRVVGLAFAIVHGDRVVHSRGFGVTGPAGAPVTPDTPFMLGSMSKAFTALSVMKLAEAGKLRLDAEVTEYLPWFRVTAPDDAGVGTPITLRHLLNHTSGIGRSADAAGGTVTTLEERVRRISGTRLESRVGTRHVYASANYQVLGLVVETVSGTPFGAFVQNEIFSPLDMTKSFVDWEAARMAGAAVGHRYWFGLPVAADLPYESDRLPSAALMASAQDLARFLVLHLGGGRYGDKVLVSPEGMKELLRPTAKTGDSGYAMGWRVGAIAGSSAIHHGGILPHYRGKLVMLPDDRWGVVVLTNTSSVLGAPTSHRLADDLAAMIVGHPARSNDAPLGRIYLLTDVLAVFLVLLWLRDMVGLRRWLARLGIARADRLQRRKVIGSIALSTAITVGLLCAPWAFGLPWGDLLRNMPDFGALVLATQTVALAVIAAKAYFTWRALTRALPFERASANEP